MRKSKLLYLTMQQFLFLMYFLISYSIYTIAMKQGNEGITIQILGGKDDGFFYWEQVKNIVSGDQAILTSIYPLIIGTVVKLTGIQDVYIIRLFNYLGFVGFVFVSAWIIDLVFRYSNKTVEDTLNERSNSKTILILSFIVYTSLLMYATFSIYRDIWIMFFYLLSVFFSLLIIFNPKQAYLLIAFLVPSLWIMGELRFYAVGSFMLTLIIYYTYKRIRNVKRPLLVAGIFLLIFILYYTLLMDYQLPYLKMSLGDALDYRTSALTNYSGGSQMYINLKKKFFGTFLINYFHSYMSNSIGPLPWQIKSFGGLLLFAIESIPMMCVLSFIWIKRIFLTPIHNYLLLHAFVWFGLIGLSNDNTGTAARLRMVGWVLIIIVFATVYSTNKRMKKELLLQKDIF